MNTLIMEDEQLAVDRLQRIIQKNFTEIEVIESLDTVKDGVEFLSEHEHDLDLIFCDIHLADGSSFEIFDRVEVKTPIIFTTAYDEYSMDAFKVNSIHYLLKPLKEKEVIDAVDKYELFQGRKSGDLKLNDLKKILVTPKESVKKRFLVKSGLRLIPKRNEDIALFYIDNRVVHVLDRHDGRSYLTDFTLEEIENDQANSNQFFRINRKQIVNMEAITSMKPFTGQRLSLDLVVRCNFDIIVSREKVTQFKKWFTG
ncbi:MAG: LytTR family DNA-binding domain-containing protein [Bacteroidota bacterium]